MELSASIKKLMDIHEFWIMHFEAVHLLVGGFAQSC